MYIRFHFETEIVCRRVDLQRDQNKHHILAVECPIARALVEIGDSWTMLILREAMYGTRTFDDFHRNLGIARNILSDRLKRMVENGLLTRKANEQDRRSQLYFLTPKGRGVWPLLIGLTMWSNEWIVEEGSQPVLIKNSKSDQRISRICAVDSDDGVVELRDAVLEPGPGASDHLRQRIEEIVFKKKGQSSS